jgi:hypothetical protein
MRAAAAAKLGAKRHSIVKNLTVATETDSSQALVIDVSSAATIRMIHTGPSWDSFLVSGQQANFEANIGALVGFKGSPQWNVIKTWNLTYGVFDYLNTWSDTNASYAVYQNDSDGAPLYNPFANNERRAMDLRSQTFRDGFVADCIAVMDDGGAGMFFDDVNLATTHEPR